MTETGQPPSPMGAIDVAAGLVFREGRLLITQRRMQDHLGGLWEFPGGKREPTETFEDCLRRELKEELGIEVRVLELVASITHRYPEKRVHLKFYRCAWVNHEPQALGCRALAWTDAACLAQYCFPAADAQLLEQLIQTPAWWNENVPIAGNQDLKACRKIPRSRVGTNCG